MVCHRWPGITPHPAGHPGSVWDLHYGTWVQFALAADHYVEQMKEANR